MEWNKITKQSGCHECPQMDIHLTSLGFTQESVKYLTNPCNIHSWKLLENSEELSQRILKDIQDGKKMRIIGDYDCDGVCATAILYMTLDYCGACVDYAIPHRIKNGYGLSKGLVDDAINDNVDIIITCDNGISALEAIQYAKDNGLIVYLTDHHTPGAELPKADLIIHPMLGDYPFPYISGAQVAYKVCLGILEAYNVSNPKGTSLKKRLKIEKQLKDYMFQLATLTIISDVMPVASVDEELAKVNENRKWLMNGIRMIQENPNWHIKKLLEFQNVTQENFDEQSIGFYIAPAINAVGRLTDAKYAVEFFIAQSNEEVERNGSFLIYINEERKTLKKQTMSQIHLEDDGCVNIVVQEGIHEGLIGLLAGAYTNDTGKATVVLTDCMVDGKKAWKGSARGTGEISLYDTLSKIQADANLLYAFGGHADAAGMTVLDKNIEAFREMFKELIEEKLALSTQMQNYIEIHNRKERLALTEAVRELKPFGNGLPQPIIEMTYNVSEVDLYYKSNHAKTVQFEMEMSKGKKSFPMIELWVFNGLDKVKPYCDDRFIKTDNIERIVERDNLTFTEAEQMKAECYKRKKDKKAPFTYKIEVGYSDFNGMGPRYNVLEIA